MMITNKNRIAIISGSKRCEPSGFLFNKAVTFLSINGYDIQFDSIKECDTHLINTCCVTKAKMLEAEELIKKSLQEPTAKRIIIFGCLARFAKKNIKDKRILIIDSRNINKFDQAFLHKISIECVTTGSLDHRVFTPYQRKITEKDYFILISQGCIHNCSYCNIKKAKGYVKSRSNIDIIKDIRKGVERGSKEFVLLADDCGSFGRDTGTDLVCLIKEIFFNFTKIKLKISTLFPGDFIRFYSDLRDFIADGKIAYLNIPLQSGSNRILELMNRNYDINIVKKYIKEIKDICPNVWLYTHILANFPTETRHDYLQSLQAAMLFNEFMVIAYSDNPLTLASKIMPKVNSIEQEKRIQIANEIINFKKCGVVVSKMDIDTYAEISDKKEESGRVVQLCLTYDCQCNCRHCGVKYLSHSIKNKMSLSRINKILTDLKLARFNHVDLSGGEPTLRKDIFEIIRLGKQRALSMSIETNGLFLTPAFLERLKQSGIDIVYLSIDDYRAVPHDLNRGRKGVFRSALNALRYAHKIGLEVHASTVPRSRKYFEKGLVNKQIKFLLENGAERVRVLFPSYVGNCSQGKKIFCSEQDEMYLLDFIDKKYEDVVYVESPLSYLSTVRRDRKVLCPAKSVFSYISCNGYVMPCPYLPLIFGDINKESIIEIFTRIQEHPFMRCDGIYCPTRDKGYLATCLKGVDMKTPFKFVRSLNRINCYARCNNHCQHCHLPQGHSNTTELLDSVNKIDKKYSSIHLYGGEMFLRKDILFVLKKISSDFKIIVHTNARIFISYSLTEKLSLFKIKSVKVPFFALDEEKFNKITRVEGSYRQALRGIANLCKAGLPVSVYIPQEESGKDLQLLISLGIVSISSYKMSDSNPLPDSVLCFGNRLRETSLLWLKT